MLVQHREVVRRIEAVDPSVSVDLDEAARAGQGRWSSSTAPTSIANRSSA